ncbi:MAG: DUF192 domain-containing protein [Albidovulum sp.]|nr:DUF192 domain-containing protein [Albidovulum sp.]
MPRKHRIAGPIARATFFAVAAFFAIWPVSPVLGACAAGVADVRGDWGSARFRVEVADTPEQRSRGLMYRDSLPSQSGMLLLFEKPGPVSIWMKNTFIPLDIVFVSESGEIRHVHPNAKPGSLASIRGGDDIVAVLEINGGVAEQLGLGAGSEMRHPGLPQSKALWVCQ